MIRTISFEGPPNYMDHQYIEEQGIASRYSLDLLPVGERLRFEEHFIDCEACLDQLDLLVDCRKTMRKAGMKKAALAGLHPLSPKPGRLAWQRLAWQFALFTGAALLLILSSLFAMEIRRLRQELNRMKAAAVWQPAISSDSTRQEPQATPTARDDEPDHSLRDDEPDHSLQPQANIPIFYLSSVRNGGGPQSEAVNEIDIPSSIGWMVFSIELDGPPEYQTYRASISTAKGRSVWRESQLQPDHNGALSVNFPSTFFRAGDYLLELEGLGSDRQPAAIANYPFRITSKKNLK